MTSSALFSVITLDDLYIQIYPVGGVCTYFTYFTLLLYFTFIFQVQVFALENFNMIMEFILLHGHEVLNFRNGKSMGVAFNNVAHGAGLAYFPAVSLAMQEHLYANFGHVPFV